MGNIKTIADLTMNVFYGDYANSAEFFDIDDFVAYTGMAYADLLGQEYQIMYNQMRQDGEANIVEFSHDWLKQEVLERQQGDEGYFVELSQGVISFPFDKRDVSIQNIFPTKKEFKGELIRSSISEIWMDEYLPLSNKVFWALLGKKIYLSSKLAEPPKEVRVVYLPGVSEDLDIPASRQKMVMDNTIRMMRESAKGYLVKETNDQNLNKAPQTELDRNLIKN